MIKSRNGLQLENFKRTKITEIPETVYGFGGQAYQAYREVNVIRGWKRLGHYLIDALIIAGIRMVFNLIFGYVAPEVTFTTPEQFMQLELKLAAIGMAETLLYYGGFEIILGSTPGKMLLGRMVIDQYGERPPATTILLRTICRLIPFEVFSCLMPRGWHDQLSKTFVVDQAEVDRLWDLMAAHERTTVQQQADDYLNQQGQ